MRLVHKIVRSHHPNTPVCAHIQQLCITGHQISYIPLYRPGKKWLIFGVTANTSLWGRHTRWLTVITVDPSQFGADREAIRLALEAENIEARPRPAGTRKPMHKQPVFHGCASVGGGVAESLFRDGLCLPSGSNLTEGDLARVVEVIRRVQGQTHL